MKNINILPTDKPSNIGYYTDIKDTRLYILSNGNKIGNYKNNWNPQNIYITNDEEIKEGDAYITKHGEICKNHNGSKILLFKTDKKIILTTDQDLIKDGVQSIPDDFLEWFVKNPSCEEVAVEKYLSFGGGYQIFTPKEEPKQELEEIECNNCGYLMSLKEDESIYICTNSECTSCYEEGEWYCGDCNSLLDECICIEEITDLPKQETLEEAAEIEANDEKHQDIMLDYQYGIFYGFIEGAKWQAEQDKNKFSEEEMENRMQIVFELTNKGYSVDEIFEQFKKK